MQRALAALDEHRTLFRHYGGFWYPFHPADKPPGFMDRALTPRTMDGLSRRGLIEFGLHDRLDRGFMVSIAILTKKGNQ
jgi:hypothetical protein